MIPDDVNDILLSDLSCHEISAKAVKQLAED